MNTFFDPTNNTVKLSAYIAAMADSDPVPPFAARYNAASTAKEFEARARQAFGHYDKDVADMLTFGTRLGFEFVHGALVRRGWPMWELEVLGYIEDALPEHWLSDGGVRNLAYHTTEPMPGELDGVILSVRWAAVVPKSGAWEILYTVNVEEGGACTTVAMVARLLED